ncbi:protein-export chaperone SecB [Alphaproteobacteria bacterium]|nr:protein-export chaperone SecB [Alphaproteobacteria bacterium]
MTKKKTTADAPAADNTGAEEQGAARTNRQLVVHAQFVKDLSFENPNAPDILMESPGQPDVEISVNVGARKINDEQYEVLLNLSAKAVSGETALFLVELTYAGIVSAPGASDGELNPLIMIEAPRLLFPFARAIISDVTRDGGFMPLNIQPVDFVSVYQHNLAKQQEAAGQAPADDGAERTH